MDKNAIKKYAVWARRELISRVSQKALQYGITDKDIVPATATSVNGVVLSADEMKQRKALIEQINSKGYEQVMEEVAYTWFNRFIALRFMEVNGYLPSHVRVFTDEENDFKPQILAEAINLELDGLDMEKVYALKDANDNDALFKYLVIVQCNALNPILPRMFQRIADYSELLFPDNLLREGSAIEQMIAMIPEEDWKDAVQIIGWLYQYYNSEKKDEVFAALKKNVKITKENIPAATQMFTPDWIVRYMVENLGRMWVEGHPNEELRAGWKYYLDEAEQEPAVQTKLAAIHNEYASIKPEQIKCIDPCAGSGHILAYMFDVLIQIYEAYGYTAREAVRSIVENNIYGLDIDDRAAQLAYFAVMMKARQYDRRYLTRKDENGNPDVPQPHVYAIVESNGIDGYAIEYFINDDPTLKVAVSSIIREMHDAKEYGSVLNITPVNFEALNARLAEVSDDISISRETVLTDILPLIRVAEVMTQKYDVVVTNPPYMGASGMSPKLYEFVKNEYPETKSDMSTVCMEKTISMCKQHGYMAMINIPVWMFISSYEKLRKAVIQKNTVCNLLYPGRGVFGSDFGTVIFTFAKAHIKGYKGTYRKLFDKQSAVDTVEEKERLFFTDKGRYTFCQTDFLKIPGYPFAFWISDMMLESFSGKTVKDYGFAGIGMRTGDNNRFLRLWQEIDYSTLGLGFRDAAEQIDSKTTWIPYNKGGSFRKWYGNNDYVVNWFNNGEEIKENTRKVYPQLGDNLGWKISNEKYYFQKGITWTGVTMADFSCRLYPEGFIFDSGANGLFPYEERMRLYLAGFLNSKIANDLLRMINPTVNTGAGTLNAVPVIYSAKYEHEVRELVEECLAISKADWDAFENSWDFVRCPLIRGFSTIEKSYLAFSDECEWRFSKLKTNEERLNEIFIDVFSLDDGTSKDVAEEMVTIRKVSREEAVKNLISYAVGCMFGRYSLDVPGLVYAGGEWDESKYVTFKADKDSIIPICDDEYFADDIVGRFMRFIEVAYGKDTLQENLCFIADALGGSGQPKDVIRNYFLNDFYADHCTTYSVTGSGKRPIYWLFDSGKKGGFKALVYMHRYQPDTIARMRTDYVHEQQSRYRTAIADLEQRIASASTSERVKLSKRLKTLQEQASEIQGYEEKIHHLADQYIAIDLDDGVKVNYAKFQNVLAKIK